MNRVKNMLDNFVDGLNGVIGEIIVGLLLPILVSVSVGTGLIPSYFIVFFYLINIVDILDLIQKMPSWATFYNVGWLVGVIILAYVGLLTIIEILIYFLIPLAYLVYKFCKWRRMGA